MSAPQPDVVLVNPNTNRATTRMMTDRLRGALGECGVPGTPGLPVTGLTVADGPAMITTQDALDASAGHVVDLVTGLPERPAAVVVAAFGDPGVTRLRDAGFRVVGIGEAAVAGAAAGGDRFAVATTTPGLVDAIGALVVRTLGEKAAQRLFTGVELTATDPIVLASDPDAARAELGAVVRRATDAGARRVIIGGGPLSGAAADLAGRYPGVVVEPVPAAAAVVAAMLRHS